MQRGRYELEVINGGQNAVRADQTLDLKIQGIEGGKINQTQSTQKDPPRPQMPRLVGRRWSRT